MGRIGDKMSKLTEEEQSMIDRFCPTMVYTMNRKTLKSLLLDRGSCPFWNGMVYSIKSKHIGAGVYEVTGKFQE